MCVLLKPFVYSLSSYSVSGHKIAIDLNNFQKMLKECVRVRLLAAAVQ